MNNDPCKTHQCTDKSKPTCDASSGTAKCVCKVSAESCFAQGKEFDAEKCKCVCKKKKSKCDLGGSVFKGERKGHQVTIKFEKALVDLDADGDGFFAPGRTGHVQFDLPRYVLHRLSRAGLAMVSWTGHNTYDLADDFFSYRRATHHGEPDYGRQISGIALAP